MTDSKPAIEYEPGFLQERTGVYAFFGRVIDEGFDTVPTYGPESLENFLGSKVESALDQMSVEGSIDREFSDDIHSHVYSMSNEEAKADAVLTWRTVREQYDGDVAAITEKWEDLAQELENKGVKFIQ